MVKNFQSQFYPDLVDDDRDTIKRYILDLLHKLLESMPIDLVQSTSSKARKGKEKALSNAILYASTVSGYKSTEHVFITFKQ